MISNVAENPAIRFLIGIFLISIGTALYLVGSWNTTDQMVIFIKLVSLVMVIEGALFLAVGEWVQVQSKLQPAKLVSDKGGGSWYVQYANSSARVLVRDTLMRTPSGSDRKSVV